MKITNYEILEKEGLKIEERKTRIDRGRAAARQAEKGGWNYELIIRH